MYRVGFQYFGFQWSAVGRGPAELADAPALFVDVLRRMRRERGTLIRESDSQIIPR